MEKEKREKRQSVRSMKMKVGSNRAKRTAAVTLDEAGKGLLDVIEVDKDVVDEVDADVVAVGVPGVGTDDLEGVHDIRDKTVALRDEVLGGPHRPCRDCLRSATESDRATESLDIPWRRPGRTSARMKKRTSEEFSLPSAL